MEFNLFTLVFLIATLSYVVTLLWLNVRQDKAVIKSYEQVPSEFSKKITLKEHQKAAEYTQPSLRLIILKLCFQPLYY